MSHIEIFGPPGSGKSTIYARLLSNPKLFGGTKADAVRRVFLHEANPRYTFLYKLVPSFIQSSIEGKLLRYRYGDPAFVKFISEHRGFMDILSQSLYWNQLEKCDVFITLKHTAENYQMGISAKKPGEWLFMDDFGFCQRAESIMLHTDESLFSLEAYFKVVPVPKIIIHVDVPGDVSISRQVKRGVVIITEPQEIERLREINFKISNYLKSKYGAYVITIENTQSLEDTVFRIDERLEKMLSR